MVFPIEHVEADLTTGLVGYWSFDEGTDDIAHDSSDSDNDGTIYGATWTTGIKENALYFDGTDDWVNVSDPSDDLDFGTNDFTICYWIKPYSFNTIYFDSHIELGIESPPLSRLSIGQFDDFLHVYTGGDWHNTSKSIEVLHWVFITWIREDNLLKLYVNGNYSGWNMEDMYSLGPFESMFIARNGPTFFFHGTMDEIYIYNRALNEDEIQALYTPDTVYVDDDYSSSTPGWQYNHFEVIQDGIDAVDENGTVYVNSGTYYETVDISKDGVKLIGEDKNTTIINANYMGEGISVEIPSHYMTISNLTIRNANGSGILFFDRISGTDVQHNTISNCIVYQSTINHDEPAYDWADGHGIFLGGHDASLEDNLIINCTTYDNDLSGIVIMRSAYDQMSNNEIIGCESYSNGFKSWTGNYSKNGISIGEHTDRYIQNTIISQCEVYSNACDGIYIGDFTSGTLITNNIISNNNGIGINISGSSHSDFIYYNNFINNNQNAYDDGTNTWYNTALHEGNYWSDYTGYDADQDGIGDIPYNISGGSNQDLYPLGVFQNIPPTADFAYTPTSPTDSDTIQFTDTSTDIDGTITAWSWEFGDGETSTLENPTHQYGDEGSYLVNLTVSDNDSASDDVQKTLVVTNGIPSAHIDSIDPSPAKTGTSVTFTGHGEDGTHSLIAYEWTSNMSGVISTSASFTNSSLPLGNHLISFRVQDDDSIWSSTVTETLIIYYENTLPIADANGPYNGIAGNPIEFDGSGSYDPDGTLINYTWDFDDGNYSYVQNPTHVYASEGTYDITLTVTDNVTATSSDTTIAYVVKDTQPPTKVTGLTVVNLKDGKLQLSWNQASDNVGVVKYHIYRDNVSLTNTTQKSYKDTGLTNDQAYTYRVSAVDNAGNEGEKSDPVTQTPTKKTSSGGGGGGSSGPANTNPVADASNGEPYEGQVGESILFDGSLSSDPDGDNLTYTWYFGDESTGAGKTTTHTYEEIGTYTVILTVEDVYGAIDSDETEVVILEKNDPPSKPTISGEQTGTINTEYSYIIGATDPDKDAVIYRIIWGDQTSSITESDPIPSGTAYVVNHTWIAAGKFTISVTASDNTTTSAQSTFTVYIDAMQMGEHGYVIDTNNDGIYDRYYNETSQVETTLGMENSKYLIDEDGDGQWDYTYTDAQGLNPYEKQEEQPGFELVILLIGLLVVFYWKRKKE